MVEKLSEKMPEWAYRNLVGGKLCEVLIFADEVRSLESRLVEAEKWVDVWIERSNKEMTRLTPISDVNLTYLKGIFHGITEVEPKIKTEKEIRERLDENLRILANFDGSGEFESNKTHVQRIINILKWVLGESLG